MSSVTFRHEFNRVLKDKGTKNILKEQIIDGIKGLSFILLIKEGEKFTKIQVKEISKDKFSLKMKVDNKETSKEIDLPELKKMIKNNKDLLFVKNYLKNEKNKTGGKADIKKVSKKATKKSTKKSTKKGTKKSSKKA